MLAKTARRAIWFLGVALLPVCQAASGPAVPALIVINASPDRFPAATANLSAKLTAAGYTVTVATSTPGSLSTFKQIWDLRVDFLQPVISNSDIAAYVAYMAGGGSLVMIGESNLFFSDRNGSIASLIQSAGGGSLTLQDPSSPDPQTVLSPFTAPGTVSTVTFRAPGAVTTPGTGAFITSQGSALFFARGKLANAKAGSLIVVFDINFLVLDTSLIGIVSPDPANSSVFTDNLIAGVIAPAPSAPSSSPAGVPTLSEWGMILLAGGLALVAARKLRVPGFAATK
jgi:hypothetical protein